jgi:hypothetical protein
MFIQTRHRAIEMSKGSMTPSFEYFCKGLINEQEMLIASRQLTYNKALMTHNKKNPNKVFNKNPKSHTKDLPNTLLMMLVMMLVKIKCLILVSIVAKPTTLKIFPLNIDMNLLKPRRNHLLNNMFLYVPIMFN